MSPAPAFNAGQIPPPQHNMQQAADRAIQQLARQEADQLRWLGAREDGQRWRLTVLEAELAVDLQAGRVFHDRREVNMMWRILVLHYLCIQDRPDTLEPRIVFAELPECRAYDSVYRGRVIARLCATAGRDEPTLRRGMELVRGRVVEGGDLAFDLRAFPRLDLRLVWYCGDDEFPPSASLLLPPNIREFFVGEDVVVLSERVVARLAGKPF